MAGMCLNFVGPDALIGPLGGSFYRKSFAPGDAADGLRLRYAPPRSIGPLSPDPITGVNPSARQIISGAQNLSGCPQFLPGHWALDLRKIAAAAIPPLRLALPSKRSRSVFRRRGGPRGRPEHGSASVQPPQKEGTVSSFAVGAGVLTRPR